ncbi:MAG: hypothetical protein L3J54_14780 [Draconibacterium sp.]|nr:hypothetical protein [Draconibacterium sp.]
MHPSREQIEHQLQKLLNSSKFKKSQVNCDLLQYLIIETLAGRHPNELEIGIEVFNKKYEEKGRINANIRVYIYNLRKKLKEYYSAEGALDELIFEIGKGDYFVIFKWREKNEQNQIKPGSGFKVSFFVLAGIFIVTIVVIFTFYKPHRSQFKNAPIWNNFYNSDLPILVVLGDYFLMETDILTGREGFVRDRYINSINDYNQFIQENPELKNNLKPAVFTYVAKSAPICMGMIQSVLDDLRKDFQIKLASELQISDFKNFNIVFIGAYKSKQPIENIIYGMKMKYNIIESGRKYLISNDPDVVTYEIIEDDIMKVDYCTILNFESFSGNRYLFFLSSESAGNISLVRLFTDKTMLNEFFKNHVVPLKTDQFKALYRVKGLKTTDFSYEFVRIDSLTYKK